MSEKIRVILADDHPIVRMGMRAELEKLPGVEVLGEAGDGREALEMVKKHRTDVVFMDISMPNLRGIEATTRIKKDFPKVRVIIVSRWANEEYYWAALKAGAAGYLLKRAAITDVAKALRRVMDGEIYLTEEIASRMRDKFPLQQMAFAKSPLEELSDRQREVLQLIAEGQTTKAIAGLLKLSAKTVEYHRAKLMERLRIHDIPTLVKFALESGLIELFKRQGEDQDEDERSGGWGAPPLRHA